MKKMKEERRDRKGSFPRTLSTGCVPTQPLLGARSHPSCGHAVFLGILVEQNEKGEKGTDRCETREEETKEKRRQDKNAGGGEERKRRDKKRREYIRTRRGEEMRGTERREEKRRDEKRI